MTTKRKQDTYLAQLALLGRMPNLNTTLQLAALWQRTLAQQHRYCRRHHLRPPGDMTIAACALLSSEACRHKVFARILEGPSGPSLVSVCRHREVRAYLVNILTARVQRRTACRSADQARRGDPGAIERAMRQNLHSLCVPYAEHYHRTVKSLYRSKHAYVHYGAGGQEIRDGNCYSKAWHNKYGPHH